jgi:hypothetical protein
MQELLEVHRPDNGLMQSVLEQALFNSLLDDLMDVQSESPVQPSYQGKPFLDDDSILGNSDRILFLTKELAALRTD